jgi:hypothetical protein
MVQIFKFHKQISNLNFQKCFYLFLKEWKGFPRQEISLQMTSMRRQPPLNISLEWLMSQTFYVRKLWLRQNKLHCPLNASLKYSVYKMHLLILAPVICGAYKMLMKSAPGANVIKLFTAVSYDFS